MKPYYEHAGITIYNGDCRDILPILDEVDALITDPPYGVNLGAPGKDKRGGAHGLSRRALAYSAYEDTYANFTSTVVPGLIAALDRARRGAIFIGPHLWDMPPADALAGIYNPAACGRHKWGFKTFLPILFYGTCPTTALGNGGRAITLQSAAVAEDYGHPCPKPYEWMAWLVGRASLDGETILDPFAGSGTTLVAAKKLGRKAIGIEIEERYCEIAAKRLSQSVFDFPNEIAAERLPQELQLRYAQQRAGIQGSLLESMEGEKSPLC